MQHITYFLWLMFDLPAGSVWSNLVGSLIWAAIVGSAIVVYHTKAVKKINAKLEEHSDLMRDLLDPSTPGGITEVVNQLQNGGNNGEGRHRPVGP
jgi:hypothetical protein